PAVVMALDAAAWVRPTTLGVVSGGAPVEISSATAVPAATCAPASGVWLTTRPAAIVELGAVVTAPTVNPAAAIALDANASVVSTTSGTAIVAVAFASRISIAARFQR